MLLKTSYQINQSGRQLTINTTDKENTLIYKLNHLYFAFLSQTLIKKTIINNFTSVFNSWVMNKFYCSYWDGKIQQQLLCCAQILGGLFCPLLLHITPWGAATLQLWNTRRDWFPWWYQWFCDPSCGLFKNAVHMHLSQLSSPGLT